MSEKSASANLPPQGASGHPQQLTHHEVQPTESLTVDHKLANGPSPEVDQTTAKGWKFWAIFPPLCIGTLLVALESTVTSTALPMITSALDSGDNYVWFLNGFLLTS
jgi:hypothetical protein